MEYSHSTKVYVSILTVILFCCVGIGIITIVHRMGGTVRLPFSTPSPTPDPLAPKNILILGYGGKGHEGGLLTDTMIVIHSIPKEKRVFLISIPRDLWVEVESKKGVAAGYKINAVYGIGSDNRTYPDKPEKYKEKNGALLMIKDVVGNVTGLSMDYAISVDFSGFVRLIDTLGGVTIDVPHAFVDIWYPAEGKEKETCGKSEDEMKEITATMSGNLLEEQFPCRYETVKFEKGKQVMDGRTALKFVRSRHSDTNGGDFGRSQRQQAFLMGVKNRILSFSGMTKIIPVVTDGLNMVQSDISVAEATKMVELYGTLSSYSIDSVFITDQNVLEFSTSPDGQYILIPKAGESDFTGIASYVSDEIGRKSQATGSAVVQ